MRTRKQNHNSGLTGIYRVTASNDYGINSDEILVERGVCQLLMPTAFTPNGDGLNDVFRVKYPGLYSKFFDDDIWPLGRGYFSNQRSGKRVGRKDQGHRTENRQFHLAN